MAGLAGAITAALGLAAFAAVSFIDADPIETGSITQVAQAEPRTVPPVANGSANAAAVKALPQMVDAAPRVDQASKVDRPKTSPVKASIDGRMKPDAAKPDASVLQPPAHSDATAKLEPHVPIAESEADIARLEETTGMVPALPAERPTEIARLELASGTATGSVRETAASPTPSANEVPQPELTAARTSRWVTMRAGPADEARPIGTLPAGATVQAESDCGWCAVTYKGQRGYIYKNFIRR